MAAFCLLLTKVSLTSTGIRAQISNYIHVKQWVAISRPCRNFNGDLVEARTVNYIPHEITDEITNPCPGFNVLSITAYISDSACILLKYENPWLNMH